eukprot:gene11144-3204_t
MFYPVGVRCGGEDASTCRVSKNMSQKSLSIFTTFRLCPHGEAVDVAAHM